MCLDVMPTEKKAVLSRHEANLAECGQVLEKGGEHGEGRKKSLGKVGSLGSCGFTAGCSGGCTFKKPWGKLPGVWKKSEKRGKRKGT